MSVDVWPYKLTKMSDWGNGWEYLSPELLERTDSLVTIAREVSNDPSVKLNINVAYATQGHLADSMHYKGLAFDGYLYGLKSEGQLPLMTQLFCALKAGFRGVGIYPEWLTPGIHCDVRPLAENECVHTWVRRGGSYLYIDENELKMISTQLLGGING